MRILITLLCGMLAAHTLVAQSNNVPVMHLKSGDYTVSEKLSPTNFPESNRINTAQGRIYQVIQFSTIPNQERRKQLEAGGVRFYHYLPDNSYLVSMPVSYDFSALLNSDVYGLMSFPAHAKVSEKLKAGNIPDHARRGDDRVAVNVGYVDDYPTKDVLDYFTAAGMEVVSQKDMYHQVTVVMSDLQVSIVSLFPWIVSLEPIDAPAESENLFGRTLHRSNAIASDLPAGRKYDGTGVNVAMGDDGIIGPHIDYQGRVDQSNVNNNNGDHGDHVGGTIMAAGNLDPVGRGMAFGSFLYVYSVWNAIDNSGTSYNTEGIRITSTSYSNGCNAGYTQFTAEADQLVYDNRSLVHVFSAGNDGTTDCGYGAGNTWGNVTGGVKIGKNVICVANLNASDGIAASSSRGPAADGRIKPDISAMGSNVYSTVDQNDYDFKTGTSMSCPGVSGVLAQLYHAYRDLNAGADPHSGLIKAILLNSADDIGNAGPDFIHGYGRMNGLRAVRNLENVQYMVDSLDQSDVNTHTITVPANTAQLKIMVYWHDYPAVPQAANSLVNDLDMVLTDPGATTWQPWVLDHTPNTTTLNLPATRGTDNLNNIEQVTIDNPAAGTYTLDVTGTTVPQGLQTYFVTYEFITDDVELTYPIGGESLVPGIGDLIRWDALSDTGNFTVEISYDAGANWTTLSSNVSGSDRSFYWSPTNTVTGQARVRVSRGSSVDESTDDFSIIGVPQNLRVEWVCPDSLLLEWDSVPGATGYEISRLGSMYMDSIARSTADSFVVVNTNPLQEEWYSVKALSTNDCIGRRAFAIEKPLGVFDCVLPTDVGVAEIISPARGTYSSCNQLSNIEVKVLLENTGTSPVTNIDIYYSVDGGTPTSETWTGTLQPDSVVEFTFSGTLNWLPNSTYDIESWVLFPGDQNAYNDTVFSTAETVNGMIITVPHEEEFAGWTNCSDNSNCEQTNCNLSEGWINDTNGSVDDIDWRVDNNGTPSSNTGPAQDYNPGTNAGRYLYLEASGGCAEQEAYLTSPCIDLTNAISPIMEFRYHMYGIHQGEFHIDVLAGTEWYLDVIPVELANQGNVWRLQTVDLSPFAGQIINVRFRGVTGIDYASDLAIDDIRLSDQVGLPENEFSFNIEVYPNPSQGLFTLEVDEVLGSAKIEVYNLLGEVVWQNTRTLSGAPEMIDLSAEAAGSYLLKITLDGREATQRLIIE